MHAAECDGGSSTRREQPAACSSVCDACMRIAWPVQYTAFVRSSAGTPCARTTAALSRRHASCVVASAGTVDMRCTMAAASAMPAAAAAAAAAAAVAVAVLASSVVGVMPSPLPCALLFAEMVAEDGGMRGGAAPMAPSISCSSTPPHHDASLSALRRLMSKTSQPASVVDSHGLAIPRAALVREGTSSNEDSLNSTAPRRWPSMSAVGQKMGATVRRARLSASSAPPIVSCSFRQASRSPSADTRASRSSERLVPSGRQTCTSTSLSLSFHR
eukprot:6198797-Pleurochrysis_carterae.AAC.1